MNDITYSKKNEEIECVHYNNSTRSYKPHTHAGHLTVGYVESGTVCIVIGQDNLICRAGDEFRIEPNVLHEVKTIAFKKIISSFLSFCTLLTAQGIAVLVSEVRAYAEGSTYTKCTQGLEYELEGDYAVITGYSGTSTDIVIDYEGSIDGHKITC